MELVRVKNYLLSHRTITDNKCWLFTGPHSNGYGRYKGEYTHVLSFKIFNSNYIPALCVLHKCDMPLCFNPEHLFQGTHKENVQDCIIKKRRAADKQTHCKKGHLLDNNIRNNKGHRICRTCLRNATRQYRLFNNF